MPVQYKKLGFDFPGKVKNSVYKRQNQFAAGRLCAISIIEKILGKYINIGQDSFGRPVWPKGFIGSITHTDDIAIAIVENKNNFLSIGIDAERISGSKEIISSLEDLVLVEGERELLLKAKRSDYEFILFLIFSFKESLYKCLNPLVNKMFDFSFVEIIKIDLHNNVVIIKLLKNLNKNFLINSLFEGSFEYNIKINSVLTKVAVRCTDLIL